MDPKKRYPGRSVAETGKYNLHVIFSAEEHVALATLCSLTDVPKAELIRRLVMGACNALLIPIPKPVEPLPGEQRGRGRPRRVLQAPTPVNGKKHPPSPALASTSGTFAACSSSSS